MPISCRSEARAARIQRRSNRASAPSLAHNRRLERKLNFVSVRTIKEGSSSVKPPLAARLCVCEREPPDHFAYLIPERIASEALQALPSHHWCKIGISKREERSPFVNPTVAVDWGLGKI